MSGLKMSEGMQIQSGILAAAGLEALVLQNAAGNPEGPGTTVVPLTELSPEVRAGFWEMKPGMPVQASDCKGKGFKRFVEDRGRHYVTRTAPIRTIAFGDAPDAMDAPLPIEHYRCTAKELAAVVLALLHVRSDTPTEVTISMKGAARRIFGDTPKAGSLGSRLLRKHGYVSITR